MLLVIAIILGLFLAAVVIFIIDMEDVHAGRTNTDCCLSFKQFKSFYSLNPEKWRVGSSCLGYDAHRFVLAKKVRFRSWFDVLRYYFFAKRIKKKKRMNQANQNEICKAKFSQNPDLADKLVATKDAELIEGNTWGDRIWGVCDGIGENRLGKILMRVRAEM